MNLWLCLRFDLLPLQCLNRSEEQPVAVVDRQRVFCSNHNALAQGIKPGTGVATARALAENVLLLERKPDMEAGCLAQLCCWAYSVTPNLYSYRGDCLMLEVGGCLALFRGLDILLAEVARGLESRGYQTQIGLATTPKAAWLMSFADPNQALDISCTLYQRLAPLPITLLEDFPKTVASLQRAGIHHFGALLQLPTQALGKRCSLAFTRFLEQALGNLEDLQPAYQPPREFRDEYWFGYEVKVNQEMLPAIQLLLQSFCRFLRQTQLQSGKIRWRLIGIDSKIRDLVVRSSTSHSAWENWYQLSCIQLDRLQLETGIEGLALECTELNSGQLPALDLFAPRNQKEPLASLLDRLRSRLGLQAIEKIACREEHLPELALQVSNDTGIDNRDPTPVSANRPFWLMPQPQPLKQYGSQLYWNGKLQLLYGPERIEDNWWQQAVSRDYYAAQDSTGQCYWIFRDRLNSHWYIHGVFAWLGINGVGRYLPHAEDNT